MALAELQATEALNFYGASQSAESYLSEMSQNYTNAGNICLSNSQAPVLRRSSLSLTSYLKTVINDSP